MLIDPNSRSVFPLPFAFAVFLCARASLSILYTWHAKRRKVKERERGKERERENERERERMREREKNRGGKSETIFFLLSSFSLFLQEIYLFLFLS